MVQYGVAPSAEDEVEVQGGEEEHGEHGEEEHGQRLLRLDDDCFDVFVFRHSATPLLPWNFGAKFKSPFLR